MTESDSESDESDATSARPVSVSELLARNAAAGGLPPARSRRLRRGDANAVTVAELTGELPIYRDEDHPVPPPGIRTGNRSAEPPASVDQESAPDRDQLPAGAAAATAAEDTGPDVAAGAADEHLDGVVVEVDVREAVAVADGDENLPSFLEAAEGTLFGGQTLADEVVRRRGERAEPPEVEAAVEAGTSRGSDGQVGENPARRSALAGVASTLKTLGESLLAVALGAGLYIAFDELWRWNSVLALVLSVLVILGFVVGVRAVRKTEDVVSTLIAVAVGALITLGPLALPLQAR